MKKNMKWLAVVSAFVGGFALGFLILWAVSPRPVAVQTASPIVPLPTTSTTLPAVVPSTPATTTTGELDIVWQTPKRVSYLDILGPTILAHFSDPAAKQRALDEVSSTVAVPVGAETSAGEFWNLGQVSGGAYDGWGFYYWINGNACDPGGCTDYHLIVSPDKSSVIVVSTSGYDDPAQEPSDFSQFLTTSTVALDVPSLTPPPQVLTLPNGKTVQQGYSLIENLYRPDALDGKLDGLTLISHTQEGYDLYSFTNGAGCVFVFAKDGQAYAYTSEIPQVNPTDPSFGYAVTSSVSGFVAKGYTDAVVGGCGTGNCPQTVSSTDVGTMDSLEVVGTTSDGDSVYVPKDPQHNKVVEESYENWVAYTPDGSRPPITDFLKKSPYPVFFWKDAFGRWVRFISINALPPVECGKPVIYLYPTQATDVSVRLPSFINVTKSAPTYPASGWNVTASPNGKLTLKDGTSVGSLYWEGTGAVYQAPSDGFILKAGQVDAQLKTILAKYGLNAQESQDFRDFWVPKMVGAPYYRASFLTSAWSAAVPLSVSPRPQTEIRLFMDWQKLEAPVSIVAPKIVTPKRVGFTLVEWGGLLHP